MALSAIRRGRTLGLGLVRAFTSSTLTLPSFAALRKASDSSNGAGFSHLLGSSQLYGLEKPCPPWRHLVARCRSWTELKDCTQWSVTLRFPKDPAPTREEMIDTYVKTLAAVLGSEAEAKKKIYAVCTTDYHGFACNIDEATSEKLKEQPLVHWVLPDADPNQVICGGDRYNNGVITPGPTPWTIINDTERPRRRTDDRPGFQRDSRPMEGRDNRPPFDQRNPRSMEGRDNRPPFDQRNPRPMEGRDNRPPFDQRNLRPMEGRDNRPPFEQRNPMQRDRIQPDDRRGPMPPIDRRDSYQGERRDFRPMEGRDNMPRDTMQRDQFDRRPPFEQSNPTEGYQREDMQPDDRRGPIPPFDRRDSFQGERRDTLYEGQREAGQGEGKPFN